MTHPLLLAPLGLSLVFGVADNLPEIDIVASCDEGAGFGLALPYNPQHCIADEKEARNVLEQRWTSFPAATRARCVDEIRAGTPSYVDVLTCLEMSKEAEQDAAKREADSGKRLIGASKKKRGIE